MCSYVVLNKQANAPLTRPKVHIIPRKMKHIYNGYKKERGGAFASGTLIIHMYYCSCP
jgi:hypothetical protein